ncbi:MAG TPA: hypothetical protein DEH25_11150, partial [Chloroflexi bacterium]|nr:hypothetical protein [Chloroflexota bacterium]
PSERSQSQNQPTSRITEVSRPYEPPVPENGDDEIPWDDDGPPPPDAFPPGWDDFLEPVASVKTPVEAYSELVTAAKMPESSVEREKPIHAQVYEPEPEGEQKPSVTEATPMPVDVAHQPVVELPIPSVEPLIQPKFSEKIINPIIPPMPTTDGKGISMITVILRPRADKVRDNLLLRRVFGLMISSPGNDRFAFHIFEKGRGHLLEFPNLATGITPELVARLNDLVGPENVRIEPITFQ